MRCSTAFAGGLAALAMAACAQTTESTQGAKASQAESTPVTEPRPINTSNAAVVITVRGEQGTAVTGSDQLDVRGQGTVTVGLTSLFDGAATVGGGPDSSLPQAIDFPPYIASGTYPVAVIRLTPESGRSLDPGNADFRFSAVFRVAPRSSGRTIDDGNNLFQRGLSSDPSMFKLEVDDDNPTCTVKGEAGEVIVRSSVDVSPGAWYRATCTRTREQVSITVTPQGGAGNSASAITPGASGTLTFPAEQPASIGGKLDKFGEIVIAGSDQFNGAVALVKCRRL